MIYEIATMIAVLTKHFDRSIFNQVKNCDNGHNPYYEVLIIKTVTMATILITSSNPHNKACDHKACD